MRRSVLILSLLAFALACGGVDPLRNAQRSSELERVAQMVTSGDPSALAEVRSYTEAFPEEPLGWVILGNLISDADDFDGAIDAYNRALVLDPKQFQAVTGKGIVYRKRGDYESALKAYHRAVEIDPTYAQAYSSMAIIHLKREEFDKAVEVCERGWALDKTDPAIAANLAIAYHYAGDETKRDAMKEEARRLNYSSLSALDDIIEGRSTVLD